MSAPAAFSGTYSDFKTIKTRKVVQVHIELPIEQGAAFVAAFGMPNPGAEIPVAVARLNVDASTGASASRRKFDDMPIAQQAGIRANDPVFQTFAVELLKAPAKSELGAADAIRKWCGVNSRADIDASASARAAWNRLEDKFIAWRAA